MLHLDLLLWVMADYGTVASDTYDITKTEKMCCLIVGNPVHVIGCKLQQALGVFLCIVVVLFSVLWYTVQY